MQEFILVPAGKKNKGAEGTLLLSKGSTLCTQVPRLLMRVKGSNVDVPVSRGEPAVQLRQEGSWHFCRQV